MIGIILDLRYLQVTRLHIDTWKDDLGYKQEETYSQKQDGEQRKTSDINFWLPHAQRACTCTYKQCIREFGSITELKII